MEDFDSNYYSEGEFDDSDELCWDEYRWQLFLMKRKVELAYFKKLYHDLRNEKLTWESLMKEMGWVVELNEENLSNEELDPESKQLSLGGNAVFIEITSEIVPIDGEANNYSEIEDFYDPYTVHKHPLYVITEGIIGYIHEKYERLLRTKPQLLTGVLSWNIAKLLGHIRSEAISAFHAMDEGDYTLTVAHLKQCVAWINDFMKMLAQIQLKKSITLKKIRYAAFDLRDVYIKAMTDCRECSSLDYDA